MVVRISTIFAALLFLCSVGCDSCGADVAGCESEDECKGSRICADGLCQMPGAVGGDDTSNNTGTANNGGSNTTTDPSTVPCDPVCTGDSLCTEGECLDVCEQDGDCGDDEVCTSRVDGPGRVCQVGDRCRPTSGRGDDDLCLQDFDCDDAGPLELRCDGSNPGENGVVATEWECDCIVGGTVEATFEWQGNPCDILSLGSDTPQYLCEIEGLYF